MTINRVIEYEFPTGYRVIWLEEILKEFNIETKESWYKEDDFFETPIYKFTEPEYPEFYSLLYTCLPEKGNFAHEFAEMLIEAMLQTTGYLEGCLKLDIENKKEDAE